MLRNLVVLLFIVCAVFGTAANAQNFRSADLIQGQAFKALNKKVALTADDQAVSVGKETVIELTSDNTTAANRTFTLSASTVGIGHNLYLYFSSGSSYTAQLADSGTMKLIEAWEPVQYDWLHLIFDGTNWNEIGRGGTQGIVAASIVNADISASAAIAYSKLATDTAGDVLIANGSGVVTGTAFSGDVTVNSSGVTAIGANKVLDTMLEPEVMVITAAGTLSQAQLLAISTPVTLIAAPSAGQVIVVDEIELFHDYATAAYATGADLQIEYATSGDNIALVVDSFVTGGADASVIIKPSTYDLDGSTGTAAGFDVTANAAKAVQVTGSNFTNGNASNIIKYKIRYHVVTLLN